ncbi:MAG: phosphodiester glycosidase family protein [Sediminibacterium sp.]
MRKIFLVAALLASNHFAFAQWNWTMVDSSFGDLPPSIHVYYTESPTEGKPNKAYYVSVDMNDRSVNFSARVGNGKRLTPQQYFQIEHQPVLVMNCTFFEFVHNSNLNVVMRDGKLLSYQVQQTPAKGKDSGMYYHFLGSAIGINERRKADVAWLFVDSASRYPRATQEPIKSWKDSLSNPAAATFLQQGRFRKWKMQTAVGGGPVLLQQGNVQITNNEERKFAGTAIKDKHPRTAMGYTADGRLILLVVEGRNPGKAEGATLPQLAEMFRQLGCIEALNLDGGGSSCLLVNGKNTIQPSDKEGQRPVPAVFIVERNRP